MKFCTLINQIMLSMMVISIFRNFLTPVIFGQILSQTEMCSVFNEIWYTDQKNYFKHDSDIIFAKSIAPVCTTSFSWKHISQLYYFDDMVSAGFGWFRVVPSFSTYPA